MKKFWAEEFLTTIAVSRMESVLAESGCNAHFTAKAKKYPRHHWILGGKYIK
ncbi:hypothetical protein [Ferrimonas sediminicola]|uniref:hypothetical protein n=1 Tax=Ferrimonas sediminicola TaxID=2569538 RepID=UPI00145FC342|nr:hypothetical protein [Ferrimonas sediminicola]